MSCFIKRIEGLGSFYCIDDYFGAHRYGYVRMSDLEVESIEPWLLLEFKTLEGRGGSRRVLNEEEFSLLIKNYETITRGSYS